MELRDYQRDAVDAVFGEWAKERRRTLVVQATGTGKTVVFATVAGRVAAQGGRTLVLAHRGELLDQAEAKISAVTGLSCAREQAASSCLGTHNAVTVGSVQTLCREGRLYRIDPGRFDLVVVDEAHHALSDSYRRVLDHFGGARVLGVTATADRSDRRGLSEVFDSVAYEYGLARAVKEGHLSPIRALTVPLDIDISGVSQSNGDYTAGQLGDALDPYLDAIADVIASRFADRRTVCFLPLVRTAEALRDRLLERGVAAAEVDGASEDRAEAIADFASGRTSVLCNSMLLTEGWDCPAVDCVAVLRPTRSRSLYCQMVGRGTRLSPETGKDHLLLLDFLWQTGRMDLCRPASLMGADPEVSARMDEIVAGEADGAGADLMDVEVMAAEDVQEARERALATKLAEMRKHKSRLVDPLQFEVSICDADLSGYEPAFAWERSEPSARQLDALERWGIDGSAMCRGKASKVLDSLKRRADAGMATPKQVRMLERKGFRHPGTWTFAQASAMMSRLAQNHWRVPVGVDPATYDPRAA